MVLIAIGQVFCRMFLSLGLPNVFLLFRLNYGFGGRTWQKWSTFISSYQGIRAMNTTCTLVMLALIAWLRILIVRFLCRNIFPLPHSDLWKQVTKSGPHLRNRVSFTFLEGKHLHILFRIFLKGRLVSSVIFIYLYSHLFVLLWIMYISCILRIIIHYRHTSFGCPFRRSWTFYR